MGYTFFIPTRKEAASIFGSENFTEEGGFVYLKDMLHTVVIGGLGKVNSAVTLTRYLCANPAGGSTFVLMGIAGAYKESGLGAGDIVMVKDDYFVDEALLAEDNLKGTHELGFPICDGNKVTFDTPFGLPACDANTVSLLSGTDYLAGLYHNKTGAFIESMEGAAFALAAVQAGINPIQVRAVSNYCGARDGQCWDTKKAFKSLRKFINNMA